MKGFDGKYFKKPASRAGISLYFRGNFQKQKLPTKKLELQALLLYKAWDQSNLAFGFEFGLI